MKCLTGLQHPCFIGYVYIKKKLNIGKITPEEWFTNAYVEELYDSEYVHTTTKPLHVILYTK